MDDLKIGESENISLPAPETAGSMPLTEALLRRRSVRDFVRRPLSQSQLSQLLWSAQGVTGPYDYKRTPPSAGGLCPLEIYVVIGDVTGIVPGVYRYQPTSHTLLQTDPVDVRKALGKAALNQNWLADASAVFVLAAVYERTTVKYGNRGFRYVHMDVAFAAENLHLQAVADGLGTVVMGAFDDDEVQSVMNLKANERPLLILPVGWPS